MSRAVLGGTRYPLYFKNWVFLRDFERGQNTAKLLPEVGILKILCPKLGRRGLSSRALNVPSKHDQKNQKISSHTLRGLNYSETWPFGQKILFSKSRRFGAKPQGPADWVQENAKIRETTYDTAPPPLRNRQTVLSEGGGGTNAAAAATNRARIVGRVVPYARRRSN